jgi:hypothetical protein
MGRVFLHLGAHKTGTTFIQSNLLANQDFLGSLGWRFVYLQHHDRATYAAVRRLRKRPGKAPNAARRLHDFLQALTAENDKVFLSSEALLGGMSLARSGLMYPNCGAMLDHIAAGLQGADVQAAYCVRSYADYIESSYHWLVANGKVQPFGEYVERLEPQNLSWPNIIEAIEAKFGRDNLHLWTYEGFKRDPIECIRTMLRAAGIQTDGFSVRHEDPLNTSYSRGGLRIAMAWNRMLSANTDLTERKRKTLRRDMRVLLNSAPSANGLRPRLLHPKLRNELVRKYEDDLAIINKRWGDRQFPIPSPSLSSSQPSQSFHSSIASLVKQLADESDIR